jgi:hypothetical protein
MGGQAINIFSFEANVVQDERGLRTCLVECSLSPATFHALQARLTRQSDVLAAR